MEQSQVIYSKCCNKLVSACVVPFCYTDTDWKRQVGRAAKAGCKIDLVTNDVVRSEFDICDCKKTKPQN